MGWESKYELLECKGAAQKYCNKKHFRTDSIIREIEGAFVIPRILPKIRLEFLIELIIL